MIVNEDDCSGRFPYGWCKHLAGMYNRLVQTPFRYLYLTGDPVLAIQQQRQKELIADVPQLMVEKIKDLGR